MIIDYPKLDLIEQLIKKCDENFVGDDSKRSLKTFYEEFFCAVGDLSKRDDLSLFLEFLISRQDRFHVAVRINVKKEEQTRLLELYEALIIKIRTELKEKGEL